MSETTKRGGEMAGRRLSPFRPPRLAAGPPPAPQAEGPSTVNPLSPTSRKDRSSPPGRPKTRPFPFPGPQVHPPSPSASGEEVGLRSALPPSRRGEGREGTSLQPAFEEEGAAEKTRGERGRGGPRHLHEYIRSNIQKSCAIAKMIE